MTPGQVRLCHAPSVAASRRHGVSHYWHYPYSLIWFAGDWFSCVDSPYDTPRNPYSLTLYAGDWFSLDDSSYDML